MPEENHDYYEICYYDILFSEIDVMQYAMRRINILCLQYIKVRFIALSYLLCGAKKVITRMIITYSNNHMFFNEIRFLNCSNDSSNGLKKIENECSTF